jgi:hypothetical protein
MSETEKQKYTAPPRKRNTKNGKAARRGGEKKEKVKFAVDSIDPLSAKFRERVCARAGSRGWGRGRGGD